MPACRQPQRRTVRRHDRSSRDFLARAPWLQVQGLKGSEFGWHRLRGALEHDLIEFDEFQRGDEPKNDRPVCGHVFV